MKTAEEWKDDYSWTGITVDEVKAIQLDAWKQGMTDAAGIVRMSKAIGKLSDKVCAAEEILAARHAKTEL